MLLKVKCLPVKQLLLILTYVVILFTTLHVQAQTNHATPLTGLYKRLAADIMADKPLIISAHYGMWHVRANQPERNLNWGGKYGHATMLKKAKKDSSIKKLYTFNRWNLVHEDKSSAQNSKQALRTLVFYQSLKIPKFWRDYIPSDVIQNKKIKVFLVMQAYSSQEQAAIDMVSALRKNKGRILHIKKHGHLHLGDAQIVGYFGHNFFYDYDDFDWDGLDQIHGKVNQAKGVFAVGCHTARVPGFPRLVTNHVYALLFSKTLMASEGYSTLALADSILKALNSKQMVKFANRTYRYYQKKERPHRKVGKPFVSHNYLMYPIP